MQKQTLHNKSLSIKPALQLVSRIHKYPPLRVFGNQSPDLLRLPNRSEYIRDAVIEKLTKDGLLPSDQDSDS